MSLCWFRWQFRWIRSIDNAFSCFVLCHIYNMLTFSILFVCYIVAKLLILALSAWIVVVVNKKRKKKRTSTRTKQEKKSETHRNIIFICKRSLVLFQHDVPTKTPFTQNIVLINKLLDLFVFIQHSHIHDAFSG